MQSTNQGPLFWIQSDKIATNQNLIDGENEQPFFPAVIQEIQTPAAISVICLVSAYFFESIFFQTCFVISSAHLATRLVKKIFADYSFMHSLQKQALIITRRTPHTYILVTLIAFLFAWHMPLLSLTASIFLGTLSALAIELYSQGAACDLEKTDGNR